jgi:hypothetical protein
MQLDEFADTAGLVHICGVARPSQWLLTRLKTWHQIIDEPETGFH